MPLAVLTELAAVTELVTELPAEPTELATKPLPSTYLLAAVRSVELLPRLLPRLLLLLLCAELGHTCEHSIQLLFFKKKDREYFFFLLLVGRFEPKMTTLLTSS